jgi:hypothetical protein
MISVLSHVEKHAFIVLTHHIFLNPFWHGSDPESARGLEEFLLFKTISMSTSKVRDMPP